MKLCGIDLAVKRPSTVGVLLGDKIEVFEAGDEGIVKLCEDAEVVSIDSPLSHSKGFRDVDKQMIRNGYRVLPPSWMKGLVDKALALSSTLRGTVIETHPTSSLKNIGLDWRKFGVKKDLIDAVVCSLVSLFYKRGEAMEIKGSDGAIYLLPKKRIEVIRITDSVYTFLE
ncbi:DUF429 domain-containing protein [Stygiolobus caldivivus]|uniref:DUF429 domain-containing protein n=1 Tax=Stygiolobus caldivivus TaxID=2824673 RepID=A0A8D5U4X4_9CREN|nr:hypothetical protein [Stygiolobus caldivivus]BCU69158.1 hypothetical protein KN1_04550 [Stygiolobus caldivivus]